MHNVTEYCAPDHPAAERHARPLLIRPLSFLLLLFSLLIAPPVFSREITPSVTYAEAVRMSKEVELLKAHLNLTEIKQAPKIQTTLLPRHVWQKCYLIQLKINRFRRQHGFPIVSPSALEPVLTLEPVLVYEQIHRLHTEIELIKERFGITEQVPPQESIPNKQPIDVFNMLNFVSMQWDVLNHQEINPAEIYAEVKRINEDINIILDHLRVRNTAYPPAKTVDAKPEAILNAVFELLTQVQRIQQLVGIPRVDFTVFHQTEQVISSDVLNLISMVQAELQVIKAALGLTHKLTPAPEKHAEKNADNILQLLGYLTKKLQLIRSL